jgi:hypothetical protein
MSKAYQAYLGEGLTRSSTGSWSAGAIASFDMRMIVKSTFAANGRGNG